MPTTRSSSSSALSSSSSFSPSSSSSFSTPTDSSSSHRFCTLFNILPASAVCSFLSTADVLAVAAVDRATRLHVVSSPAVWRTRVFRAFPVPPASPTSSSSTASSSSVALPSWCSAVQVMEVDADASHHNKKPTDSLSSFASLAQYHNLRRVHAENCVFTKYATFDDDKPIVKKRKSTKSSPIPPPPSLSSMRHLTRLSLTLGGQISIEDMRLLATLPVLASFSMSHMDFEDGNKVTLKQWKALTSNKRQRIGKRKEELLGGDRDETDDGNVGQEQAMDEKEEEDGGDEDDGDDEESPEFDEYEEQEDPNDPSLPQKYSALLLFLHALASKPALVDLELEHCGMTPFVLDRMPVWPHLLSLTLKNNNSLRCYRFERAAECFPSLTSLTQPNCSDRAISYLVRLPALEELRFPEYLTTEEGGGGVLTSARGFRLLDKATKLRAIYYSPDEGADEDRPSLDTIASVHTFTNLTRITVSAFWPLDGLFTHHFPHLRCLELYRQYGCGYYFCPQTDDILLPLVKPLRALVDGRQQRQAQRAAKRQADEEGNEAGGIEEESHEGEKETEGIASAIPVDNAANFPSLECLALPYEYYNRGDNSGQVSRWMMAQLRRSYEYEVAAEWEAECTTLGAAELLKSIMA